ncbi:MAG: hypothetical protein ABI863_18345, partial [Ginsengibacter sp.]
NPWLIFFDDDNEPHLRYITQASKLINNHPEVGCWGPAQISVEYIGGQMNDWLQKMKPVFQERFIAEEKTDNNQHWQIWYPVGTGLIIRKDLAGQYAQNVLQKKYFLSDRKGKSLSSGGDVQMVLCAIKEGYKAGISPALKMNHLIKKEKTSLGYILRLTYGTASAYIPAYNQVFDEHRFEIQKAGSRKILIRIYSYFRIHYVKQKDKRDFWIGLTQVMGEFKASTDDKKFNTPLILRLYERVISYK